MIEDEIIVRGGLSEMRVRSGERQKYIARRVEELARESLRLQGEWSRLCDLGFSCSIALASAQAMEDRANREYDALIGNRRHAD